MKLGSQTNSVVNHLYSRAVIGQPKPKVGMGCTILGWTDRNAATITKVTEFCGKVWLYEIEVVEDVAKVVKGSAHDGSAEYEYTPGTGSPRLFAFDKKKQSWESVVRNPDTYKLNRVRGSGLRIGERDHYYDPCF